MPGIVKKLLWLSAACAVFVVGILFYENTVQALFASAAAPVQTIFAWVFTVALLVAVLIPFGFLVYHLSIWIEKMKEDSVLYSDKPAASRDQKKAE